MRSIIGHREALWVKPGQPGEGQGMAGMGGGWWWWVGLPPPDLFIIEHDGAGWGGMGRPCSCFVPIGVNRSVCGGGEAHRRRSRPDPNSIPP